jgi:hypothetical protein
MKSKYHTWFLAILFTLVVSALPAAAQACYGCHGYGYGYGYGWGGGGLIYSNEDQKFHSIPSDEGGMVYRSVDGKYYPVARYGYSCHRYWHHGHHRCFCNHRFVRIECQTRCGHWISSQWYPASEVCWYR